MKWKWIWLPPAAILGISLFIFIGGEAVMHLWNWLLPPLFGWRMVTFWQALGLLALCRILFGGWGGGHGSGNSKWRRGKDERCRRMSDADRERLREGVRARWDAAEPSEQSPGK